MEYDIVLENFSEFDTCLNQKEEADFRESCERAGVDYIA